MIVAIGFKGTAFNRQAPNVAHSLLGMIPINTRNLHLPNFTVQHAKMAHNLKSIDEICAVDGWYDVGVALDRGELPKLKNLIDGLRGPDPIPKKMRDHLADVLEGKAKKRPGRQKASFWTQILKKLSDRITIEEYHRIYKLIELQPKNTKTGTPSEKALEETAEYIAEELGKHLSTSTIRALVYPAKSKSGKKRS